MRATVRIVTDPMCSWCWGTTPHYEATMARLEDRVAFDIAMSGINVHSTRPVGAYGRERLGALWREVTAVTGQHFCHRLPAGTVYNSLLPCLAVEAMRDVQGAPPFGYVHRLQQRFFAEGVNVNDLETLLETAAEFGASPDAVRPLMNSAPVRERTRWSFDNARGYGTQAVPNVLVSADGATFRLLAGGFVDASQLTADVERWLDALDAAPTPSASGDLG